MPSPNPFRACLERRLGASVLTTMDNDELSVRPNYVKLLHRILILFQRTQMVPIPVERTPGPPEKELTYEGVTYPPFYTDS